MHSSFSNDGRDPPEQLCERALALGYSEIAITDHAEWHENGDGFARVKAYLAAMAACRRQFEPLGLKILSGVELGNPHEFPDETAALLAHNSLDLTIGSLHHLDGINIHAPACFRNKDPYMVFAIYFHELARMAAAADFHILGHFDRILLFPAKLGIRFDPYKLEFSIRNALATIICRGQILELNTKHLAHESGWIEALIVMIRWYLEMGGRRLIVNSDAHRQEDLGANTHLAHLVLMEAGWQRFAGAPSLSPLQIRSA